MHHAAFKQGIFAERERKREILPFLPVAKSVSDKNVIPLCFLCFKKMSIVSALCLFTYFTGRRDHLLKSSLGKIEAIVTCLQMVY